MEPGKLEAKCASSHRQPCLQLPTGLNPEHLAYMIIQVIQHRALVCKSNKGREVLLKACDILMSNDDSVLFPKSACSDTSVQTENTCTFDESHEPHKFSWVTSTQADLTTTACQTVQTDREDPLTVGRKVADLIKRKDRGIQVALTDVRKDYGSCVSPSDEELSLSDSGSSYPLGILEGKKTEKVFDIVVRDGTPSAPLTSRSNSTEWVKKNGEHSEHERGRRKSTGSIKLTKKAEHSSSSIKDGRSSPVPQVTRVLSKEKKFKEGNSPGSGSDEEGKEIKMFHGRPLLKGSKQPPVIIPLVCSNLKSLPTDPRLEKMQKHRTVLQVQHKESKPTSTCHQRKVHCFSKHGELGKHTSHSPNASLVAKRIKRSISNS